MWRVAFALLTAYDGRVLSTGEELSISISSGVCVMVIGGGMTFKSSLGTSIHVPSSICMLYIWGREGVPPGLLSERIIAGCGADVSG